MNPKVQSQTETQSMIMPGESRQVEISVQNPMGQSVQVEFMYGKTKDACAVAGIGAHSLYALKQNVTPEVILKDSAVQTGAFVDPALPMDHVLTGPACTTGTVAIDCLRELAGVNPNQPKIRFFTGYLPSLLNKLEEKFGSAETQSLMIPGGGGVQLQLKLKN